MSGKTYSDEATHREWAEQDKATNISLLKEVTDMLVEAMGHLQRCEVHSVEGRLQEAVRTLDRVVEDME